MTFQNYHFEKTKIKIQKFMTIYSFFQECPGGSVNEATFKEIYEKFFPYGSKYCWKEH